MLSSLARTCRVKISAIKLSIKCKMWVVLDSELREARRVIKEGERTETHTDDITRECDEVFVRRLATNPLALKMSFWENHFEWRSLKDYPEITGRILDFGCGSGHLDVMLARHGWTVHGIDLSHIGISLANLQRRREDPAVQERLSFAINDVTKKRIDGDLFDSAWSAHVFEHIADPVPIVKGLREWVKPGGYFLISVPFGTAYDDPGHVNHFYSAEDVKAFLRNCIDVERIDISTEYQVIRVLCRF